MPSPLAAAPSRQDGAAGAAAAAGAGAAAGAAATAGARAGASVPIGMELTQSQARLQPPLSTRSSGGAEPALPYAAAGGLLFSCLARGAGLYERPNVEAAHFAQRFPNVPLAVSTNV